MKKYYYRIKIVKEYNKITFCPQVKFGLFGKYKGIVSNLIDNYEKCDEITDVTEINGGVYLVKEKDAYTLIKKYKNKHNIIKKIISYKKVK